MKAIICNREEWQALENKVYQALVDNCVITTYENDEGMQVLPLSYSSIRTNPKSGNCAFDVRPEVEEYLTQEELDSAQELDWTWFCGVRQIKGHSEPVFYCAYSENLETIHIGIVEVGGDLSTGQLTLEWFETESELRTRVDELKSEGWYDQYLSQNRMQEEGVI